MPLLNFIGGPNTILFAAVAVALAALAWAAPGKRLRSGVCCGCPAAADRAQLSRPLIDIVYAKGMKREAPLYARWNALSRVEVDQQGTGRAIVIDADARLH